MTLFPQSMIKLFRVTSRLQQLYSMKLDPHTGQWASPSYIQKQIKNSQWAHCLKHRRKKINKPFTIVISTSGAIVFEVKNNGYTCKLHLNFFCY